MCAFIGAQAPIDTKQTGGRNPLVELAHAIDILGGEEPDPIRGEKVADDWRDDPRLARPVAADPAAGVEAENAPASYEGFMTMFGGGSPLPPGAGEPDARPDLRAEAPEEYPELRAGAS